MAVGLFGAVAHATERRAHKFGVRLALGDRHADVARRVAVEALAISTIGAAAGFVLALGLLRQCARGS